MNRRSYFNFTLSGYFSVVLPLALGVSLVSLNGPPSLSTPRMCVRGCTCNNTTVTCVDLRLRGIPQGIPPDTTTLDLTSNRITKIHVQRLSQMPELRALYLRGNRIAFIPDELHLALPQLSILDLSSNPISCRCPMAWLQKQYIDVIHRDLQLVNQNRTTCGIYQNGAGRTRLPPNLASCVSRSRQQRTPSCENLCQHGRCITTPIPHCVCEELFSGPHCKDDRTVSTTGSDNLVDITIEKISPYNITISWVVQVHEKFSFIVNVTLVSSRGYHTLRPVRTVEQSYNLGGIQPGTTYIICITAIGPVNNYTGCTNFTAPNVTATLSPALVETNVDGNSRDKDGTYPFDTKDSGGGNNNDYGGGPGVEYAFISLTSLFVICLLLTALVGLVYYKRVYGITTEDSGTSDSEVSGPNQQGIVVVSTGSDIVYNRAAVNRAFNPDDTHRTPARTYSRRTDPRSVRFNLQPRYPQRGPVAEVAGVPGSVPFTITGSDSIAQSTVVQNRGAVNVNDTHQYNESEL